VERSRRSNREGRVTSAAAFEALPVTLLTGFLGSGKTTLLRRALAAPSFSDTAVIVNEIGAIAIDHYLVDFVEGGVLELPGGCLCCMMREDLAQSLRNLIERRDAGDIRPFRRIAIETSGLADPAPILFTLGADPMLDQRLRLGRVVTLVDAAAGATTLDRFAEAARQAAVADALVVSKTDLAPLGPALAERLDRINPGAERILGAAAADPATILFAAPCPSPASRERVAEAQPRPGEGVCNPALGRPLAPTLSPGGGEGVFRGTVEHAHSHGIAVFAVTLEGAVGRFEFARALGGLARDRGNDLLRVKGIVEFADRPGRPAIVQAAQHAMFTPEWLDHWPDTDRRSRLVFIVHDIPPDKILGHFAFASPVLIGEPVSHH
jgi:G3E family GTPase